MSDSRELRALVERVAADILEKRNANRSEAREFIAGSAKEAPAVSPVKGKILVFYETPAPQASLPPGRVLWKHELAIEPENLNSAEIASISIPSLSKLAHMIWDCSFLEQIGNLVIGGTEVWLTDPTWKRKDLPAPVAGLLERAKRLGIRMGHETKTARQVTAMNKVITREDILHFSQAGNRIVRVPAGSIITPLARETAENQGIKLDPA